MPRAPTSPSSRDTRRRSSCSSSSATIRPGRSRRSSSTRAIHRTFYFWHVYVVGVTPGMGYAYRVDGPKDLHGAGHRFNPNKVLIDPYGRGTTSTLWDRVAACGPEDNLAHSLSSVVIDMTDYDWEGDTPLNRSMQDTVIYEMHVRGFTKSPTSGVEQRRDVSRGHRQDPLPAGAGRDGGGAAAGVRVRRGRDQRHQPADRPEADQLLGLQPDQLLQPARGLLRGARRRAPTSASSGTWSRPSTRPASRSSSTSSSTTPARATTRARRSASGASTTASTTTSSRTTSSSTRTCRAAGTRSTATCPLVEKFIAECLLFWVREMHVDGFRFDLASILSRGPDGNPMDDPAGPVAHRARQRAGRHQDHRRGVGRRRAVPGRLLPGLSLGRVERPLPRRHPALRQGRHGASSGRSPRGSRAAPTSTRPDGELPINSINFITAHDGFTLNDLVSYNGKHNEANGEGNRDGTDDNLSWNCGAEGDTDDPGIEALRARQVRNFLTILMLSQGVPMMVMGDEARQTQFGNNNAYCQDNEITWFDWTHDRAARRPRPVHRRAHRLPQGAADRSAATRSSPARSTNAGWPTSRGTAAVSSPRLGRSGVARARLHARRLPDAHRPASRARPTRTST